MKKWNYIFLKKNNEFGFFVKILYLNKLDEKTLLSFIFLNLFSILIVNLTGAGKFNFFFKKIFWLRSFKVKDIRIITIGLTA